MTPTDLCGTVCQLSTHCRDIAPLGKDLAETNKFLDLVAEVALELQKGTNIRPLWGTAQLFKDPRYMHGAATSKCTWRLFGWDVCVDSVLWHMGTDECDDLCLQICEFKYCRFRDLGCVAHMAVHGSLSEQGAGLCPRSCSVLCCTMVCTAYLTAVCCSGSTTGVRTAVTVHILCPEQVAHLLVDVRSTHNSLRPPPLLICLSRSQRDRVCVCGRPSEESNGCHPAAGW
jgi:hypothetical protein